MSILKYANKYLNFRWFPEYSFYILDSTEMRLQTVFPQEVSAYKIVYLYTKLLRQLLQCNLHHKLPQRRTLKSNLTV